MKIINFLNYIPHKTAYAHCDIPCGIYDPNALQMAAHTVYRMTDMLVDEKDSHDIARITYVKEKHGENAEKELVTLMYDYFKNDHYEKYPKLEELFDEAVELTAKTRQEIDLEAATQLIEKTQEIAEIFYDSKGVGSKKVKSIYPTGLEVVVQK